MSDIIYDYVKEMLDSISKDKVELDIGEMKVPIVFSDIKMLEHDVVDYNNLNLFGFDLVSEAGLSSENLESITNTIINASEREKVENAVSDLTTPLLVIVYGRTVCVSKINPDGKFGYLAGVAVINGKFTEEDIKLRIQNDLLNLLKVTSYINGVISYEELLEGE